MSGSNEDVEAQLAALFGADEVEIAQRDGRRDILIKRDEEGPFPFTFAQMMQLPAILGTEHLDFRADTHSHGAESGSWGHCSRLMIKATP